LSKQDSKRIIKNVIKLSLKPIMHLNPDDVNENEIQEVNEMMKTLLEKSRSQHDG